MGYVARFGLLVLVALAAAYAPAAEAQVAIDGGSGLFGNDKARTLGNGSFGVGVTYQGGNYGHGALSDVDYSRLTGSATVGVGDAFEFSLGVPSENRKPKVGDDVNGLTDSTFKAKWNFLASEKHRLRLSAIGLLLLPTGDKDKGFGTGGTDAGLKLALDKDYEQVSWHFNAGYLASNHADLGIDPRYLYGAGIEYFPLPDLSLIAEFNGDTWTSKLAGRDDSTIVVAGGRYYLGEWGSVQAGYRSWGGGSQPNYEMFAGITVDLGLGAPKPMTAEPVAVIEEPGAVTVVLEAVHFAFDKADLTDEAKMILRANAGKLTANPGVSLVIEGHTCSIGAKGYNQKLGLRRAIAAKKYLVEQGIEADRMSLISYGEERPVASNDTKEGRILNRRADFVIEMK